MNTAARYLPLPVRQAASAMSAAVRDLPRYRRALAQPTADYLGLCNRGEQVEAAPRDTGYRCQWQWTSELRAPRLLPSLGAQLMNRALVDAPISIRPSPAKLASPPDITFLIGHRGTARLPLLLATLGSIAAQTDVSVECIVVEQDVSPRIAHQLPSWVHYIHECIGDPDAPYCRSSTFNVGARHARAPILVLHDNDMLVPTRYARDIADRVQWGYEAVNLKRFIFYLDEQASKQVIHQRECARGGGIQAIVQNLEAGGSVAITREGYERIGGMDESFVGWGGEDNEFWERAGTLRIWPWAHLPIVHLWHAAQPGKGNPDHEPLRHYRELSRVPPETRIEVLRGAQPPARMTCDEPR